jgi:hypothetical protein
MATKVWGPLGWMTLHSISSIYPEAPTQNERVLLEKFVELYRETITCIHCKTHFSAMLTTYKQVHPEWSSSRYHCMLFVCRAHNTVNKRLDKPVFPTMQSCVDRFRDNTKITSAAAYRSAYINYLISSWQREMSSEGYMNADNARRMRTINEEYFTPRDTPAADGITVQEGNVLEFIPEDYRRYATGNGIPNVASLLNRSTSSPAVGFRFSGGRLKIL